LDAEWLATLPPNLWSSIQAALTIRDFLLLVPSNAFDALAACVGDNPETPLNAKYHLVFYSIMRGHLKAAEESLARLRLETFAELSGIIALARGNVEEAVIRFEQELTHLKKETGKRKACFTGLLGVFHQLALIRAGLPEHLKTAVQLAAFGLKQGNGGGVASWERRRGRERRRDKSRRGQISPQTLSYRARNGRGSDRYPRQPQGLAFRPVRGHAPVPEHPPRRHPPVNEEIRTLVRYRLERAFETIEEARLLLAGAYQHLCKPALLRQPLCRFGVAAAS